MRRKIHDTRAFWVLFFKVLWILDFFLLALWKIRVKLTDLNEIHALSKMRYSYFMTFAAVSALNSRNAALSLFLRFVFIASRVAFHFRLSLYHIHKLPFAFTVFLIFLLESRSLLCECICVTFGWLMSTSEKDNSLSVMLDTSVRQQWCSLDA